MLMTMFRVGKHMLMPGYEHGICVATTSSSWYHKPVYIPFYRPVCGTATCATLVETPIHDSVRELITWECKEHGVNIMNVLAHPNFRKEVLGVGIGIFGGLSNFTQIFEARVL
jgi:hypothetical protein